MNPRASRRLSRRRRPYGTPSRLDSVSPTLKRGANVLCAYGARGSACSAPFSNALRRRKNAAVLSGTAAEVSAGVPKNSGSSGELLTSKTRPRAESCGWLAPGLKARRGRFRGLKAPAPSDCLKAAAVSGRVKALLLSNASGRLKAPCSFRLRESRLLLPAGTIALKRNP
jgi:hypothetical protein